jgi:hypothetical protein
MKMLYKTRSFASKDLDKLKPGDIDNFINQGRIKSDERGKIQSYWDQASSTKKELFKNIIYRLQLLTMLLMST